MHVIENEIQMQKLLCGNQMANVHNNGLVLHFLLETTPPTTWKKTFRSSGVTQTRNNNDVVMKTNSASHLLLTPVSLFPPPRSHGIQNHFIHPNTQSPGEMLNNMWCKHANDVLNGAHMHAKYGDNDECG